MTWLIRAILAVLRFTDSDCPFGILDLQILIALLEDDYCKTDIEYKSVEKRV
jgi:hypothetical protein